MKSDKFLITSGEEKAALNRVELFAVCYNFVPKDVLKIRLLAEEILAMVSPTFYLTPGRCWVSTDKEAFSLSIDCDAGIYGLDADRKRQLLKLGTVKSKGVFGMLGKALDYLSNNDVNVDAYAGQSLFYLDGSMGMYTWNPVLLQSPVPPPAAPKKTESENDQELELRIIEGIADDIKVGIQRSQSGLRLEITVLKAFTPEQASGIEF